MRRLGLILLLLVAAASAQNQYYVSPTGSGTACTSGSPCSLATAMSNFVLANPGGAVINFAPGATSYGTFSLARGGSGTNRLVWKCSSPSNSGNTCKFTRINTFGVNNVDIGALPFGGFEITNPGSNVAIDNVCNSCGGSNSIHALGNYMHNIGTTDACGDLFSAAFLGGGSSKTGADDDTVVAGNLIDLIGNASCGSVNTMHGIYVSTTPAQIYNNIITRVVIGAAVQAYHLACRFRISNNDFLNDHIGLILYSTTTTTACTPGLNSIDNNVIANSIQQGVFTSSPPGDCTSPGFPTLFSNNDMFGNAGGNFNASAASCETRANPKSENPNSSFVNNTGTALGDYHLKPASILNAAGTTICVAGGPSPCTPTKDITNATRPIPPSVGAFDTGGGGCTGGTVTLTPSLVGFGNSLVGVTSNAIPAVLTNTTCSSISIVSTTLGGTNPADFAFTAPGATLASGASVNIPATIKPLALGNRTATLTVTYGAGTMLTINLAGTGVGAPALCYSPASVTFSPQQVGIPSSGSSFTVTNCGNANLTVSALTVAVNPAEFSETDNCGSRPFTLAAGAFCTVNAVFTPNGTGTRNGTVRATDNATGSPQSQPLSGDGFNSIIPPETIMIKGSVVITGGVVIGGPPN